MTAQSNAHSKSGRVLRLPPRKGLWLLHYDQVKYRTPFQQAASVILGCLALVYAATFGWIMWSAKTGTWMGVIIIVAAFAYGLINAPAGIIYWLRRWRGEVTDYFDYEVVEPGGDDDSVEGESHAPDHR